MYCKLLTSSLYGLYGEMTWVEVDSDSGLPVVNIVGLANQSIRESRDRVHSAICNSGFDFPSRRITVNLSPANKQKSGSHYDLPIALGILNSSGRLLFNKSSYFDDGKTAFLGELSLDGKMNRVEGLLPMILGLKKEGVRNFFIPSVNREEALLVKGINIFPASDLVEVINHLSGFSLIQSLFTDDYPVPHYDAACPDFSDIKGQESVKRAAQVAAAGMHGMLMIGPPGVGKSMIGKRMPGLLPELSYDEMLEITQIYSIAGELSENIPLIVNRPFRSPHHTASAGAIIGGGTSPRPGEVSLAHRGVLFLDELPEFPSHILDMLRQPMEDRRVNIVRVNGKVTYPSDFMLVAAMNPCKCGYYGDPVKSCTCNESDRKKYAAKISGPLLDRIDLHITMNRIHYEEFISRKPGPSTAELKQAVSNAVFVQNERYKGTDIHFNSQLSADMISIYCILDDTCEKLMREAYSRWNLSARSCTKILKLARTIADMELCNEIKEKHLLEALSYRMPGIYFD